MQIGAATMEKNMESHLKIKDGITFCYCSVIVVPSPRPLLSPAQAIPLLGIYPKDPETSIQKNMHPYVYSSAILTIAKIWKQPKCPSVDEWIKKLCYIYTMKFYAAVKKKKLTFCNSMGGPKENYAKRIKPVSEKKIPHDFTYMWNLMNTLN